MPEFFTTKFSLWVIAGLLLVLVAVSGVEELRISNWQSDYDALQVKLDQANANLAVSKANVATLSAGVAQQNATIKSLQAQADAARAAADARVKAALASHKSQPKVVGAGPTVMNLWIQRLYGVIP